MSMSTHVMGVIPPDEKWKQMKAVWDSCETAGISVPKEVEKFFNYEKPDDAGVIFDLVLPYARRYSDTGSEGYEIDVKDIPENVKTIRFYNSW